MCPCVLYIQRIKERKVCGMPNSIREIPGIYSILQQAGISQSAARAILDADNRPETLAELQGAGLIPLSGQPQGSQGRLPHSMSIGGFRDPSGSALYSPCGG